MQALLTICNPLLHRYPGHAIVATEFTREALSSGSGLFEYGTEAFTKLACARPVYLQTILDLGFSVVWSDTDTVWLQDFLKLTPNVRMPYSQSRMHGCSRVHSSCSTRSI